MRCEANHSPTGTVCGKETGASFRICDACVVRVHATMMRTLRHYFRDEVADTLDAHYQKHHSPDERARGLVCPECFRAGHHRTVTNAKKGLHYERACFTV